ncbi:MAG: DUF393 domain-containing protein [Bacteroidetes bacterium]|nr:MAG: DUF393 domain-containing protein [Bacteroidota bacterium]
MSDFNTNNPIIFFDGICNLCNSVVQFVIKHDKKKRYLFCPLQSDKTKEVFGEFNNQLTKAETIILFEENKLYFGSTAALNIVKHLNLLYPILFFFIIIPKPLREFVYRFIAKHRYKWFGKRESCMLPTDDLKNRFID